MGVRLTPCAKEFIFILGRIYEREKGSGASFKSGREIFNLGRLCERKLGGKMREADYSEFGLLAEKFGALIGLKLLDDLVRAQDQAARFALLQSALQDLHDAPAAAASGFAVRIVNVLEVGLQHLPVIEDELDESVEEGA